MRAKILFSTLFTGIFLYGAGVPLPAVCQPEDQHRIETVDLPFKDEPFAAFIYKQTLWLVAGNSAHLSVENLRKPDSHFIKDITQLPVKNAEVFLFTLHGDLSAAVQRSTETGIHIILRHGDTKPDNPIALSMPQSVTKQYSLVIAAESAKDILSFTSPITGEEFLVAPLAEIGEGIYPAHSFSQFRLLQSAQGIAIEQLSDDVKAAVTKGNVVVSAASGLNVTGAAAEQINAPTEESETGSDDSTLFPYSKWKLSDNKLFVPEQEKLFRDIAFGDMRAADNARLRLLHIYLANGLFAEAVGMSDDILRNSYKFYRDNKVSALRGAAYFFMQRLNEAKRDFSTPELADDKEIAMWHALCEQLQGSDTAVFNFPANYDNYISKYPPPFIQKLALIAADLSIKRKDFDGASEVFRLLAKANLDEPLRKYIEYMQAEIYSETQNEDEAQKIWEKQAADVDDPLIRASAEFSLVNILIREDKIATDKAIKKLDRLLIVWRGDALELNILTLLSSLYVEEKQYGKALSTMRNIVWYFPQSPQVLSVSEKMEDIFMNLFNKDGADKMSPIDALTLFYEFRDLVPAGKDGDMMVRNLADRLVGVDLLDRAAMLLEHQVDKRLHGEERSRVGAHLAAIYLKNHKPKDALDVLETTGYGRLPPDLLLERTHLTAKALAEEEKSDKAIQVLSNDNSTEGNLLRLSIYWANKDWPNVTLVAEEILGNRNDPTAPLTKDEADVLLKLATSYVYERDNGQLQYLRDYFTPLLKNNPDKSGFLFITSESDVLDYNNISSMDSDIKTIKSYVEASRAEAKKRDLSNFP